MNWLIWKDPDAGKDWRQENGMTEDKMVGQHHQLDGHEFEQAPENGEGQGSLVCCSPQGCNSQTRISIWTELSSWFFPCHPLHTGRSLLSQTLKGTSLKIPRALSLYSYFLLLFALKLAALASPNSKPCLLTWVWILAPPCLPLGGWGKSQITSFVLPLLKIMVVH